MSITNAESLYRIIAIVFYSGIGVYFYRKYQKERIPISLYWMITFIMWALGSIIALVIYLMTNDNLLASSYFAMFLAIGVGVIASSTIEFEIIRIHKVLWYPLIAAITLLASIFTFSLEPNLFLVNKIALLCLVSLVPVPYLYLAVKGKDLRLFLVTAALFLHMPVSFILLVLFADPIIHQLIILLLDVILGLGLLAFKKE